MEADDVDFESYDYSNEDVNDEGDGDDDLGVIILVKMKMITPICTIMMIMVLRL